MADAYMENTERYFKSMEEKEGERSECATPKAPQPSNSRWSDITPTESFSQSGRYSWESVESADEEVSWTIFCVDYGCARWISWKLDACVYRQHLILYMYISS